MDELDFSKPEDFRGSEEGGGLGAPGGRGKSLAGWLLVAHPELTDPNFRRTVLLISEHDREAGAFGLILNRPTGQTVGQLMAGQALGRLKKVPVFLGGPVSVDQMTFAVFHWDAARGRLECGHHLSMEEAEESLSRENTVLRAYIGYSGWGRGQLEGELKQRSWVVLRPEPRVLDPQNAAGLWREALVPLGPSFRLQAEAPDELGLN